MSYKGFINPLVPELQAWQQLEKIGN